MCERESSEHLVCLKYSLSLICNFHLENVRKIKILSLKRPFAKEGKEGRERSSTVVARFRCVIVIMCASNQGRKSFTWEKAAANPLLCKGLDGNGVQELTVLLPRVGN